MIDLDNINSDKAQSQNLVQIHTIMPATKPIAMESHVTQNKIRNYNVPIVPNDRDIPIFLEDPIDEEQHRYLNKTSLQSK